jgi:hypothetical protein
MKLSLFVNVLFVQPSDSRNCLSHVDAAQCSHLQGMWPLALQFLPTALMLPDALSSSHRVCSLFS